MNKCGQVPFHESPVISKDVSKNQMQIANAALAV